MKSQLLYSHGYLPSLLSLPFKTSKGIEQSFFRLPQNSQKKYYIIPMEKTPVLEFLDRQICNYHHKYNYTKKDNLFCYQPDKKQIADFYRSMNDHILQGKLKNTIETKRKNRRNAKVKSQIQFNIHNPMISCVPKEISQNNLIEVDNAETVKMSKIPLFSQVESTKKKKYMIAKEIKEMLNQDIQEMLKQKEESVFRKKFPKHMAKPARHTSQNIIQTEAMIKEYNQLLIKFKNNRITPDCKLNLLEKEKDFNDFLGAANPNDQKFRILSLFKKMYMQTRQENVSQNLINYVMKFQNQDKLNRKIKINKPSIMRSKNSIPKGASMNSLSKMSSLFKLTSSKALERQRQGRKSIMSQFCKEPKEDAKDSFMQSNKTDQVKVRSRTQHQKNKIKLKI